MSIRTLGVVLAGGHGRRLGLDRPKALATLGDRTLLERAIETLEPISDRVIVAAPAALELPIEADRRVDDVPPGGVPLAGVIAAFSLFAFERAIVLGVDFPFARGRALASLLDLLPEHSAVVPTPDGVPQPLVAAYAPAVVETFAEKWSEGEQSIRRAVLTLDPRLVPDDEIARLEGGAINFFNLNTPADLERAEAMARQQAEGIA